MLQHSRADVVFTTGPDLLRWAASVGVKRTPVRLHIDLPGVPRDEQTRWQHRIERLHNDCGCSAAAVSLLGFLMAMAVYAALIGFDQELWLIALATLAGAIGTLFVGKLVGYAWSRRKLRRCVAELVPMR